MAKKSMFYGTNTTTLILVMCVMNLVTSRRSGRGCKSTNKAKPPYVVYRVFNVTLAIPVIWLQ